MANPYLSSEQFGSISPEYLVLVEGKTPFQSALTGETIHLWSKQNSHP
jgi:hypothetical protein